MSNTEFRSIYTLCRLLKKIHSKVWQCGPASLSRAVAEKEALPGALDAGPLHAGEEPGQHHSRFPEELASTSLLAVIPK